MKATYLSIVFLFFVGCSHTSNNRHESREVEIELLRSGKPYAPYGTTCNSIKSVRQSIGKNENKNQLRTFFRFISVLHLCTLEGKDPKLIVSQLEEAILLHNNSLADKCGFLHKEDIWTNSRIELVLRDNSNIQTSITYSGFRALYFRILSEDCEVYVGRWTPVPPELVHYFYSQETTEFMESNLENITND